MKLQVVIPVGPGHEKTKFRALESVRIAVNNGTGAFDDVRCIVVDDTDGEIGRSAARNQAVAQADADWLFFLDADDLMHSHALTAIEDHLHLDAVWGQILEFDGGCIKERYQVPSISEYKDLIQYDPYLTLQMGHFVRSSVAKATPFQEEMDAGEDWDYYLRVWRNYRCAKIERPLMLNARGEHSTGPRSATGREWTSIVHGMLATAREMLEEDAA